MNITKLDLVVPSHGAASASEVLSALRVVDPSRLQGSAEIDAIDPDRAVSNPIAAFARAPRACLERLDGSFEDITTCLSDNGLRPEDFLPIRRFKSATPNAVLGARLGEATVALVAMRLPDDVTDPVHTGSVHLFRLTPEKGLIDYIQFTVDGIPRSWLYSLAGHAYDSLRKATDWEK